MVLRIIPFLFIAIASLANATMTTTATADGDVSACDPSAPVELANQVCEASLKTPACQRLAKFPELASHLRRCDAPAKPVSAMTLVGRCLKLAPKPFVDGVTSIARSLLASAKATNENRNAVIDLCRADAGNKRALAKQVPDFATWSAAELDQADCGTIVVSIQDQFVRERREQANARATGQFPTVTVPKAQTREALLDSFYRDFTQARRDELACLDPKGIVDLWCYRFFSVVDPLLAVSIAGKSMALVRYFLKGEELAGELKAADAAGRTPTNRFFDGGTPKARGLELTPTNDPQLRAWELEERGHFAEARALNDQIREGLENGNIVDEKTVLAGDGKTGARFVTLDNGLEGVWKPAKGQGANGGAEIAVADVDRELGSKQVGATVAKKLDGQEGTLQIRTKNPDQAALVARPPHFEMFDYLVANNDRHAANYLTVDGRPVAIDHGLAFHWDPNAFPENVRAAVAPAKEQSAVRKAAESRLAKARSEGASDDAIKALEENVRAAASKEKQVKDEALGRLLGYNIDRNVVQKLRVTTDARWEEVLGQNISRGQLRAFLKRRDQLLKALDEAKDVLGERMYPDGPTSPLVREAPGR